MTLALLPSGTVKFNGQVLASGSFLSFTLPVGLHLVTVVGEDGIERSLSLAVTPGKNKAQKFQLKDLPRK